MKKLLILLMLLASSSAWPVETDQAREPRTTDKAQQPAESPFDKHPECMEPGANTAAGECIVHSGPPSSHLRPPAPVETTPPTHPTAPSSPPKLRSGPVDSGK